VGWPSMVMPPMFSVLGRGTYFSMAVDARLSRFAGIRLPGKEERTIWGLAALTGRDGSKLGFGAELNGLKMFTPAPLKSPAISSGAGTVSTIVVARTLRSRSKFAKKKVF